VSSVSRRLLFDRGDRVSGSRSLSASGSMRLFGPPIAETRRVPYDPEGGVATGGSPDTVSSADPMSSVQRSASRLGT